MAFHDTCSQYYFYNSRQSILSDTVSIKAKLYYKFFCYQTRTIWQFLRAPLSKKAFAFEERNAIFVSTSHYWSVFKNNGVMIKAPNWVGEMEALGLLRQDLQFKLAYYESQCRIFERNYRKKFLEFDLELRAAAQEDFQKWEDYMDWETADSARQEIEQRLQELVAWKI